MDKNEKRSPHVWKEKPEMEKEFIRLCLEAVNQHGYSGTSLKSWTNIYTTLNTKFQQKFDQKAVKNKWNNLKRSYMVWRTLTHKTGHGYNAETGTFDWPDE
ncbi:hypothetical protein MKX01_030651, partial [Papaver californicum]